jgi:hypothetical protein
MSFIERRSGLERRERHLRSGEERRKGIERRNGMAVLLAGCPDCGRIAPPPVEMHETGWLILADDDGLSFIACPEHRGLYEGGGHAPSRSDTVSGY